MNRMNGLALGEKLRSLHKPRVLIVDDERRVAQLLKLYFEEQHRYEGIVALSGKRAVELVRDQKPDLVLLDIRMPDMDGLETLRRIKAVAPEIPVAMLTGVWDEQEAKSCFDAGAYEYITKPVDLEYLDMVLWTKLL